MPDRLTPGAIRAEWRLRSPNAIVGRRLYCFAQLDSTNTWLLRAARRGAPEGIVALADHQTAGRGRRGRSWIAPAGAAVLGSILLRPNLPHEKLASLTMLAGCAAVAAVEALGLRAWLKWPNDLVADDRGQWTADGKGASREQSSAHRPPSILKKLGGVLIEGGIEEGRLVYAVVGIGVNANFDPGAHPEIADTATSLQRLAGSPVSRPRFVAALLQALDDRYRALRAGETASIYEEWRGRLATLGQRVVVHLPDAELVGRAEDVLPHGELVLRADGGGRHHLVFGEVSLRQVDA